MKSLRGRLDLALTVSKDTSFAVISIGEKCGAALAMRLGSTVWAGRQAAEQGSRCGVDHSLDTFLQAARQKAGRLVPGDGAEVDGGAAAGPGDRLPQAMRRVQHLVVGKHFRANVVAGIHQTAPRAFSISACCGMISAAPPLRRSGPT